MTEKRQMWGEELVLIEKEKNTAIKMKRFLINLFGKETFEGDPAEVLTKITKKIVETRDDPNISKRQRLKLYGILICEGMKFRDTKNTPFTVELGNFDKHADADNTLWIRNPSLEKKETKQEDKARKILIYTFNVRRMLQGKSPVFRSKSVYTNPRRVCGIHDLDAFFGQLITDSNNPE